MHCVGLHMIKVDKTLITAHGTRVRNFTPDMPLFQQLENHVLVNKTKHAHTSHTDRTLVKCWQYLTAHIKYER